MTTLDIVQRLAIVANLKPGEMLPAEIASPNENWGLHISQLCADAKTEIERLRLAKLPAWAQAALTSSSADIAIVGTPAKEG